MNKASLMIAAVILVTGFGACSNAKEKASQDAASFTAYVDSVVNLDPAITIANWRVIDTGYQERVMQAEKNMVLLETDDKAKAERSKEKYAALRTLNETRLKELEAETKLAASIAAYRQMLRDSLFGINRVGPDLNFSFVIANNVVDVYKKFVDMVAYNKKNYTHEDWQDIKLMYQALNKRKDEIEKDLSDQDDIKITGLKIRFTSIKAFNQGGG